MKLEQIGSTGASSAWQTKDQQRPPSSRPMEHGDRQDEVLTQLVP